MLAGWKGERFMKGPKLLGAVLLGLGLLALAYGGFSYTRQLEQICVAPFHVEATDDERVSNPLWAGLGGAIVGGVLLARRD
jgi:hypothetical protein